MIISIKIPSNLSISVLQMTLVFMVLTLLGCASQRTMDSADKYSGQWMSFGNGGGFAGIETKYILKEGRVWGINPEGAEFVIKELDEDTWTQVFSNAKTIGLHDLTYAVPGNTYNFIEVTSEGKTARVVWDDQRRPPLSNSVLVFHRRLMYLVRN